MDVELDSQASGCITDYEDFEAGIYDSQDSFVASEWEDGGCWPSGLTEPEESSDSRDSSRSDAADRGRTLWRWHLTWYATEDELTSHDGQRRFSAMLALHSKKWVFQLERGEESGRLHFQARVSLKVRSSKLAVRNMFLGCHITAESTRAGDTGAGEFYCMKADTREKGPWSDKDIVPYIDEQYDIGGHLRMWQEEAVRLLDVQTKRQILIIVDPIGNMGKTVFAHWLCLFYNARFIPPHCQSGDEIMQFCHGICRAGEQYTIVIDMPRAIDFGRFAPALFSALETIKGGYLYDKRYKAQVKYIKPPLMVCFTNAMPALHLLTADRWRYLLLPYVGCPDGQNPSDESSEESSEPMDDSEKDD